MQRWFQYYYFIIFGKSALSDVIVILTNMKRRAGPVAIAVLHVSPKLYPLQPTSIWWPRWRWPHWNLANIFGIQLSSCFPQFIKASAAAEACYSAINRRSHGFRRQPIRFFPHGHSAKYFTHYAIPQSINSRPRPESRSVAWQHTEHSILTTEPCRLDNSVQVTTIYN